MLVRVLFLGLLIASLFVSTAARAAEIVVILSDRSPAFSEFAEHLRQSLQGSQWRIKTVLTAETLVEQAALREADAWVSVGAEALRVSLAQPQAPAVLAALVSRQTYERTIAAASRPRAGVGAVILDQPAARQIALLHQLFPERKRLGLLTSTESRSFANRIKSVAGAWQLDIEEAADDAAVVPAASRLLARIDVLLAQPDSVVYNRSNVRPILLASYRFRRPVIGFSAAFASAGALAAIYSTPLQIAGQVGEILTSGRKLPQGMVSPERFTLSYNRQVAQSLGIDLPEETVVLRALENRRYEP